MAFDELISAEAANWLSLVQSSWARWVDAANRARTSAYTSDDLFEDMRAQFTENWDAWNRMMALPTLTQLPTVMIQGKWSDLDGEPGSARVHQRLTNAFYLGSPLQLVGGGTTLTQYDIGPTGEFDGFVEVTMKQDAPQPAGTQDVYSGVVFVRFGSEPWTPLSWVVVVVTKT